RFTQRSARSSSLSRKLPTPSDMSRHHAAEPRNRPATSATADDPEAPDASPSPANTPRNEKVAAGFVNVRPNVDAHAARTPRTVVASAVRLGAATNVRAPRYRRNAPPNTRNGTDAPSSAPEISVRPKAATAPYVASAHAAPSPEAKPIRRPYAIVRRRQSAPIGPTGAAMEKPMTRPRSRKQGSTRRDSSACLASDGRMNAPKRLGVLS